jgi:hypothetical protein
MVVNKKRPNYKLKVVVKSGKWRLRNVLCDVFLPIKSSGPVKLCFYPSPKQADKLQFIPEFSIYGKIENNDGSKLVIHSNKIYCEYRPRKYLGMGSQENIWLAEPVDLEVRKFFSSRDKDDDILYVNFWLTPSTLLTPAKIMEFSGTGQVNVKTVRDFKYKLIDDTCFVFDTNFKHCYENEELKTFSELVAKCEFRKSVKDLKQLNDFLEDFLLIVSFAERNRCVCVGWDVKGKGSLINFYRRNISIPKKIKKPSVEDTLIDISEFYEYINIAYRKFIQIDEKEFIRQAIYQLVRKRETLELSFIGLYAAIENIVSSFRNQHE